MSGQQPIQAGCALGMGLNFLGQQLPRQEQVLPATLRVDSAWPHVLVLSAGGQPRAAPRPAGGQSRLAKEDLGPTAGGKPKRRRVRDSRQQELNKLAQHRYRWGCVTDV